MKRTSAEILREYGPFPGVEAVAGVSFDGNKVWFATGDRLTALDPDSGETSRTIEIGADAGTAFDGKHLFQIAETVILKIDPETGEVLGTIPAPGEGGDSGLAWAEGTLWVGQHRGCKIHQVDPETDKPYKKNYDPRVWIREAELSMAARLEEAFKDLGATGRSVTKG